MSAPTPLTLEQIRVLAAAYETTSDLRRVLAAIVDQLIQQATSIGLLVDLVERSKA